MVAVETYATMNEAAARTGGAARFIAGGTLVMREVNYGAAGIERLVRVTGAERGITSTGTGLRIGAAITMAEIIAAPETAALAAAARSVGGPAVRNMATVGGNLFAHHPYGDFAVALLALDAEVEWISGQREGVEALLARRASAAGLVAAVTVPRVSGSEFRFKKVTRTKPKGVSLMSIAVRMPGLNGPTRIAFGAMGPTPLRAKAAEAALGTRVDPASIAQACAVCTQDLQPMDDPLSSAWYRQEVAPVHLRRLLAARV